jgi:hypothetical protein
MSGLRSTLIPCAVAVLGFPVLPPAASAADGRMAVDAELVLAVDVSYSMNEDEQHLQRAGYVEALRSAEFLQALKANALGRVAITYIEWAGSADQKVLVGWTLVDGPDAARDLADRLSEAPFRRARRTSISGGIDASVRLFDQTAFTSDRRVIDVSGDGPNNDGRTVTAARDDAVAKGITVNGLPLVNIRAYLGFADIDNLDHYYEDCVIGGLGAFMIPVSDTRKFVEAIRTKLIQEISDRGPKVTFASAAAPRVSCTIGESRWRGMFRN